MNIHHIGFEVTSVQDTLWFLQDYGLSMVRKLNWQDEELVFLKNDQGQFFELVKGNQFETHVAFKVDSVQGWINYYRPDEYDGPYPVLDGETAFVRLSDVWFEISSFKI